jgi:hypothetical protein
MFLHTSLRALTCCGEENAPPSSAIVPLLTHSLCASSCLLLLPSNASSPCLFIPFLALLVSRSLPRIHSLYGQGLQQRVKEVEEELAASMSLLTTLSQELAGRKGDASRASVLGRGEESAASGRLVSGGGDDQYGNVVSASCAVVSVTDGYSRPTSGAGAALAGSVRSQSVSSGVSRLGRGSVADSKGGGGGLEREGVISSNPGLETVASAAARPLHNAPTPLRHPSPAPAPRTLAFPAPRPTVFF